MYQEINYTSERGLGHKEIICFLKSESCPQLDFFIAKNDPMLLIMDTFQKSTIELYIGHIWL